MYIAIPVKFCNYLKSKIFVSGIAIALNNRLLCYTRPLHITNLRLRGMMRGVSDVRSVSASAPIIPHFIMLKRTGFLILMQIVLAVTGAIPTALPTV